MTQELIDLRNSIVEGRYTDALAIVDELEGMSRQAILRNIQSYLKILLIYLIFNQIEQRLTKSWANSIRNSVREIKKLNLQDNKTSYCVKIDEWESMLDDEFEEAISLASEEVRDGLYSPYELTDLVEQQQIMNRAKSLLSLTYDYSVKELFSAVNNYLNQLPDGEDWQTKRR